MSRADQRRAEFEAEMAVLELEDELVAAKESGSVTQELKERLREARRAHRELRAGDAVASPETVSAKALVQEG